jgi:hypothetical protein
MSDRELARRRELDVRTLEVIRASECLNPNATLEKLMSLTQKLIEMDDLEEKVVVRAHFIGKWFIFNYYYNE